MQAGKCHSPLTTFSPWVPCRSYSDSCFLDSSLYPELADVQWCGQEKAKPGTLVWASGLNLTASMPFWDHLTASHLPYPDALSPCTSFDPWHFSSPVSASPHTQKPDWGDILQGSGPTVCRLALLPTDSQAPILNGTLVAPPCHDSPLARNHQGSWLAPHSCGQVACTENRKGDSIQGDPERLLRCGQTATWRPTRHFKKRKSGGNV